MATDLKYKVGADVSELQQGMEQGAQSVEAFEEKVVDLNATIQEQLDNTRTLRQEQRTAMQQVQKLTVAYAKLSKEEKNSDIGREMARQLSEAEKEAAKLIDASGDLSTRLRNMASDTQGLDALKEGIEAIGGVATTTLSTIATLTGNQKDFNRAIAAFTAVQTATNTIQKIANALNKDSRLLTYINTLQTKALTKAKELETATTIKATIAQKALNAVAKANPYVLLGLGIAAAATAIGLFTSGAEEATDAQKKLTLAQEAAKSANEAYTSTLVSEYSKLMSSYAKLKAEWTALANDNQRKKFINDHKNELKSLGVEINNITDAESYFKNDTDNVIKAFENRARAAAYAARAAELYRKEMEIVEKAREWQSNTNYKAGEEAYYNGPVQADNNGSTYNGGKYYYDHGTLKYTEKGALEDMKQDAAYKQFNESYQTIHKSIDDMNESYGELIKSSQTLSNATTTVTNNTNANNSATQKQITTYEEAIAEYDKLVKQQQTLKEQLYSGRVDKEFVPEFQKEIDKIDEKINDIANKWHIKAKVELEPPRDKEIEEINKIIEKATNPQSEKKYEFSFLPKNIQTEATTLLSWFERVESAREKLTEIFNSNDASDAQIAAAAQGLEMLANTYDGLKEKLDVFQIMNDETKKLTEQTENLKETYDAVGSALGSIGDIFGSLSKIFEDNAVLQVSGIIAKAVANYILGWTEATAKASALGPIGWAAFGLSTAAQVFSIVEQIKSAAKFAEGGVVGGHSYYGDKLLARVNSGETILTKDQTKTAVDKMDSNYDRESQNTNNKIVGELKIQGTDLRVILRNLENTTKKIK